MKNEGDFYGDTYNKNNKFDISFWVVFKIIIYILFSLILINLFFLILGIIIYPKIINLFLIGLGTKLL